MGNDQPIEERVEAQLREDGKTDTFWGTQDEHGHAVTKEDGELSYLRDDDGQVYVDDLNDINELEIKILAASREVC